MAQGFLELAGPLAQGMALREVEQCNELLGRFGLVLTRPQAAELVETRRVALKCNGRLEFGGGALREMLYAFSDSPFLQREDFAQIMNELVELFYQCKNETLEGLTDNELITYMRDAFNGPCGGSLTLLEMRLYEKARAVRFGGKVEDEPEKPVKMGEVDEDEDGAKA